MSRWWRTNTCERATQWISLDLDGELSQLEQAALARHLLRCARCQAVSAEVSSFTRMLREAPLIEFERKAAYASPVRTRARRVRRAGFSLAFAGFTVAAVFGGFVLSGSNPGSGSALVFQSLEQQQRFADVEVRRLEPAVFVVGAQGRCVDSCAL
jgi:predicted anti-sigma-YlaC factor YlaD